MRARTAILFVPVLAAFGSTPVSAQQADGQLFYDGRQAPGLAEAQEAEAARRAAELRAQQEKLAAEEAARQAEAERIAEEAEQRRLAEEAEAKRKAEEEATRQAEAERIAEEAERRRVAEEAEAKRKAEEEAARQAEAERIAEEAERRRLAEEAEAKRKAEEEAARQAEAERIAEEAEQRRVAEEAEAKRKAEEEAARRAVAEAERAAQPAVVLPCRKDQDFEVDLTPDQSGRVAVEIRSPCRAGQDYSIQYGKHVFVRAMDTEGRGRFQLDLFEGAKAPASLKLADGSERQLQLPDVSLTGVTKLAIVWQAPVNLDLHALEYRAKLNGAGHVRPASPASFEEAMKAVAAGGDGRGFISTAMTGEFAGTKSDVYTFVHAPGSQRGVITTFVDYESRGDMPSGETCGDGPLASISFEVVELSRGNRVSRENRTLRAAACDRPLATNVRYNPDTMNDFIVRR